MIQLYQTKRPWQNCFARALKAGTPGLGFEPRKEDSESSVIPFHHPGILCYYILFTGTYSKRAPQRQQNVYYTHSIKPGGTLHDLSAEITVICLMLGFNAAFAAYEMALASVSKSRIKHLHEMNVPGADSATCPLAALRRLQGQQASVGVGLVRDSHVP